MSADLLARLPEWEREAEAHERTAHALRQLIEAVRVLNGDAARLFALDNMGSVPVQVNQYPTEHPRGREAVRRIVRSRPGIWRVRDIKRESAARGWPSSPAAIETAVKRLQADGEAVWVSRGVYRFGPEDRDEQAPTPEKPIANEDEAKEGSGDPTRRWGPPLAHGG